MSTKTSTPDFESDYVERRTWRDALDSLLALVRGGEDVDPAELAEVRTKAESEATVESGRQGWVERKRAEKARAEAAALADELAPDIDPNEHVKGLAEAQQAWDDYQDVIISVKARFDEHDRKVSALLQAVADSGAPTVKAKSNTDQVDGGAVLAQPMSRPLPVWRGVKYGFAKFSGTFLPHRAPRHKPAFEAINRQG